MANDVFSSNTKRYSAYITIIANSINSEFPTIICDVSSKNTFQRDTLVAVNGHYKKDFNLLHPIYVTLYSPGNKTQIYLAPGYKSVVKLDLDRSVYTFEGDGYLGNSYLRDVFLAVSGKVPKVKENNVVAAPEDFIVKATRLANKRDSVYQQYINIYSSVIKSDSVIAKLFQIEKEENRFFLPRVLMNYASSRELPFTDRQSFFEKYINTLPQIQEPADSLSSENKRYFFPNLVGYYADAAYAAGDSSKIAKIGIYAYMLEISKKQFIGSTQSYLIDYYLSMLTNFTKIYNPEYPSIISLINAYKTYLGESRTHFLLKKVSDLQAIDITGEVVKKYKLITESGKEIELGQKLAPVTIVDVWATWCGPCLKSFPAMTKLKDTYRNDSSVKFIWISVDRKKEKWNATIKKLKLDTNNSFWIPGGNTSKFAEDLDIKMLPRYVIINKDGKILALNAPGISPNEKKLTSLIDHYRTIR
ncbi:TlpA family protein disulfide reductase [Dyadobacter subterraneus]|uniref:TlpA family protein disulfide reductase n=1 Tax=Dyadobacter subterraneus TaxID=2773304 RepID=A0ABR9WAY9_9BACT|nr:TlpA disulfide reductase family protein [Dyadobacter subterraneus]MBE9462643.1 TlpA family protein disulfide reductase [Dyadobacter subterraneus]